MIDILIKYARYCEKSNRYQIISSLCDCIKWLDDIPVAYQPTIPIYHCQQEREKLYAGAVDTHNFARIQTLSRAGNENNEEEQKEKASSPKKGKSLRPSVHQRDSKKTGPMPYRAKQLPVPSSIFNHSPRGSASDVGGKFPSDSHSYLANYILYVLRRSGCDEGGQ